MSLDSNVIFASTAAAIPATVAAWASLRNGRRVKTNSGRTLGQHVEDIAVTLNRHLEEDEEQFEEQRISRLADRLLLDQLVTKAIERDT